MLWNKLYAVHFFKMFFRCDFNNDRRIDVKGIGTVAKYFGKTSMP